MSSSGDDFGWGPPPGTGQPTYGATSAASTRPAAAQPGIIPLRPLSLGEVLDGAFSAIRHNPRVMFGISCIVAALSALIALPLQIHTASALVEGLSQLISTGDVAGDVLGGSEIAALLGIGVIQFIATLVLTGILIGSVSRSVIGQRVGARQAWGMTQPRLMSLLGVSVLVPLFVAGGAFLALVPFAVLAGFEIGGDELVPIGAILCLVTFVVLLIRSSISAPALILEDRLPIAGIRRSWVLTKRSAWRLIGLYCVAGLIALIISGIITQPLSMLAASITSGPNEWVIPTILVTTGQILSSAVVTPFLAAVICIAYINLRIRREALADQLAFTAAEQAASDEPTTSKIADYGQD